MTTERTWFLRNGVTQDDIAWLSSVNLIAETRFIDPGYHFQVTTITTTNELQDTMLELRFGSDIECVIECVDEIIHN